MQSNSQQAQDFSTLLLEHEHYFPHDQPIINFIQKENPAKKKSGICAWNQNNEQQHGRPGEVCISPALENHKKRIEEFFSSIRTKNGQFGKFSSKLRSKRKNSSLDHQNNQIQKGQIFLHLNSTIISFPKSRSQSRKFQNQQKLILEKLYRKRQKSKVIPREISINTTNLPITKPNFPSKDYISKNRSFIHESKIHKIYNPESKQIKQLPGLRKRFASSYYKKAAGVLQWTNKLDKNLNLSNKEIINEGYSDQKRQNKKLNSLNEDIEYVQNSKLYKTLYSSPKFTNMHIQNLNEFSITKVREEAKNTHLNRAKQVQKNNGIHLLGSTISQWKTQAQQRLKNIQQKGIQI